MSQKELDFIEMQELLPGVIAELEELKKRYQRADWTETNEIIIRDGFLSKSKKKRAREENLPFDDLIGNLHLLSEKLEEFLRWENLIKENVPLITNFAHRLTILIREIGEIEQKIKKILQKDMAYQYSTMSEHDLKSLRQTLDLPKLKRIVELSKELAAECTKANQVNSQEIALTAHARTILKKKSFGIFNTGGTLSDIISRIERYSGDFYKRGKEDFSHGVDNLFSEIARIARLGYDSLPNKLPKSDAFFRLIPEANEIIRQEDREEKLLSLMLKYHQKRLMEIEQALNKAAEQITSLTIESDSRYFSYIRGIRTTQDLEKRIKLISQALADLRSAAQSYIKKSKGALAVISEKGNLSLSAAGHLSEPKG
ncbi:hypothetical protein HY495_02935 [Candidatus Woesearchaeota archaeon]|nr:hypothetical protein [Candidatus Woesearchaeota archaeon]